MTYLWLNIASISIPLVFTFHPRLQFQRVWYAFWPATLLTAAIFIVWDVLYTRMGVWGFNPSHLIGLELASLPVEEWLFFLCIPYACVFTYHCLKRLLAPVYLTEAARKLGWMLALIFTGVGILKLDLLYTGVTCIATGFVLILHLSLTKSPYLGQFFLAYFVILLPFLLVNGILTGMFVSEPVVFYNDAENLNLRVLTIPIEDFVYCMLLLLINITIFETILQRAKKRHGTRYPKASRTGVSV